MSGAYIAGVSENLTEAEITFDKFHVMTLIGDAVDKVRRDETKSQPELKASRYLWLKNDAKLSARQMATRSLLRVFQKKYSPLAKRPYVSHLIGSSFFHRPGSASP